jgi:hypothetical protein
MKITNRKDLFMPPQQIDSQRIDTAAVKYTGYVLVTTVWCSAGLFGLYILAFYAGALYSGEMVQWNEVLPGLYQQGSLTPTTGIGIHFATGGIILLLGSIQMVEKIRLNYTAFHRWIGRLYLVSCILASVGGLTFIVLRGTIGGVVMDVGFSLYGVLMFAASIQTYRYAVSYEFELHRLWALRLYALAIGSWLYRMDYGFWIMLADGSGHLKNFQGPFDYFMSFFFYLPNLLVADLFARSRHYKAAPVVNFFSALVMILVTGFLLVGTYYFSKFYWVPAILKWF